MPGKLAVQVIHGNLFFTDRKIVGDDKTIYLAQRSFADYHGNAFAICHKTISDYVHRAKEVTAWRGWM